jgi:hypothetical protein
VRGEHRCLVLALDTRGDGVEAETVGQAAQGAGELLRRTVRVAIPCVNDRSSFMPLIGRSRRWVMEE